MFYASYGSFIHRLIQQYYTGAINRQDLTLSFLRGFSSEVQGERPSEETVRKYIVSGKNYFDSFTGLPFEPVSVEEELRFDVDGIPFVAFTDFLGAREGGLAVVDHKSRDLKPRSSGTRSGTAKDRELDAMLRQLYLYAHGVHRRYGEFPKWLCFNCFRSCRFIEEPFDKRAYIHALDWAKREIEIITEEEEFRPYLDYFPCRYLCGLHDRCCYYQGGGAY